MHISALPLLAATLSLLTTTTHAAAAGLYGQGPAILDRQAQDQSVPYSCRKSPAIFVFGDIRNFAAATSFCSRYLVSATTVTSLRTIAHPAHTTPCSHSATPTAGRLPSADDPAVRVLGKAALSEAPGGAATKRPADVSAACACLIPQPARMTVTQVSETYVHAPAATMPNGRVVVVQQAQKARMGFADMQRQFLA